MSDAQKASVRVAIVGSAGRNEDASKMSQERFQTMCSKADNIITEDWKMERSQVILVSGGSAFADHVAVRLWLEKPSAYAGLELHLPCEFELKESRFAHA